MALILYGYCMEQAIPRPAASQNTAPVCHIPELLEKVFESAADGLLIADAGGSIVRVNAAVLAIFGFAELEMLQKHLCDFFPQENIPTVNDCPTSPRPFKQRITTWRKKDGLEKHIESSCTVIHDSAGAVVGAVCSVRDISARMQAQAVLIETRDFLDNIFKSSIDCIVIKDAKGHITRASRSFLTLLGFEEDEVLGKSMGCFAPRVGETYICTTGSRQTIMQHHLVSAAEKFFYLNKQNALTNLNTFCLRKDGTIIPVEENLFALLDSRHKRVGAVAILRDSTERQRAEDALRESEERFRALSQSVPEAVIAADVYGTIVFWNTGAEKIFGYTAREICGKPVTTLVPEHLRDRDVSFLAGLRENASGAIQKKIISSGLRKDGSEFLDEVSLGVWQTRGTQYIVAIIRDITERKKAEEALRDSERRFKELADSLPQTVFELDSKFHITFVNRMALDMFGYSQPDIQSGLSVLSLFVPEQRLLVRENLHRVAAGELFGEHECTALRKDGTTFPCLVHANATCGVPEGPGIRGILIDVSVHKNLENELLKARRLESIAALAGGVAQDFASMLSGILGNINLAQLHAPTIETVAVALNSAEKSALRAKNLTDQLLLFARRGGVVKKTLCPVSLVRQAIDRALPPGSNVTCALEPHENPWPVAVDEAQIVQVYVNLLINAEHAMPEGGTIHIALHNITVGPGDNLPLQSGQYLKTIVRDQSIGILNEHVQNIFDPYFLSRQRGSGIGLATTYTIVKNHGGLVVVESEFGRGTTFYIYLPAANAVLE